MKRLASLVWAVALVSALGACEGSSPSSAQSRARPAPGPALPAPTSACERAGNVRYPLAAGAVVHRLAIAWDTHDRIDVLVHYDDVVAFTSRSSSGEGEWRRRVPPPIPDGVVSMSGVATSSGRAIAIAQKRDGTACVVELASFREPSGSARCFALGTTVGPAVALGDDGVRAFFAARDGDRAQVYAIRPSSEQQPAIAALGPMMPLAARTGYAGTTLLMSDGTGLRFASLDFASFEYAQGAVPSEARSSPGPVSSAVALSRNGFAFATGGTAYAIGGMGNPALLVLAQGATPVAAWSENREPAVLARRDDGSGWLVLQADMMLRQVQPRDARMIGAAVEVVASEPDRVNGWTVWAEPSPSGPVLRAVPSTCL
jgi:hypothetical protein